MALLQHWTMGERNAPSTCRERREKEGKRERGDRNGERHYKTNLPLILCLLTSLIFEGLSFRAGPLDHYLPPAHSPPLPLLLLLGTMDSADSGEGTYSSENVCKQ